MADIITKTIKGTEDIVSSMNVYETAIAGVVGGMVSGIEQAFLPQDTLLWRIGTQVANIGAGLVMKKTVGGTIGNVGGNALTITGAVNLGNMAADIVMGMINGSGAETDAETTTPQAVIL